MTQAHKGLKADRWQTHLKLSRPQVWETMTQQVTHELMHKDSIVGVGSGALGGLIPQGGLDDPTVHNAEEVVQDLDVELEAWFVKTVCNRAEQQCQSARQR